MIEHLRHIAGTRMGQIVLSVLIGVGLALLFRKSTQRFVAPKPQDVVGKVWGWDNKCYTYSVSDQRCASQPL